MTRFKFMTVLFALVLVAAACGDDDSSSADTAAADTSVAEVGEAHETGEAHEEGDAHEEETATTMAMEEEGHEEGDEHEEGAPADEAAEGEEHEEGDEHDEGAHDEASEADRTVEVTMSEFAFDPVSIEVSTGETVEFIVTNIGAVEHEFRLSNDHRVEEHIASGHEGHSDEGSEGGHHEEGDKLILVAPGETASLVVTFSEDTEFFTNVVCLIPGHFEAGMAGDLAYTG